MALDCIQECAIVTVDVLTNRDDGDAAVGDAQVGKDRSGQDEWLLAGDVGNLCGVEEVPRFLSIGCELWDRSVKSGNTVTL